MHEIITLQFGEQSNYIGTHFWNAQESYFTYSQNEESPVNHDVHFRAGIGSDGSETFTPRTVIYDVKENFGTLRQVNALYEIQDQGETHPGVWGNAPLLRQQPSILPHQYQLALDAGTQPQPISASSVRFWSDFNRVYYHPRSMVQLNLPTSHITPATGTDVMPLDQWSVGEELFKTEDQEHDLLDRDLRPFVEECDQLQGFQVLTGADDAWAGFSGRYVERLKDEYGRKSIWAWGTEHAAVESISREKLRHQVLNTAKSLSLLSEQTTLYVPLANMPRSRSVPYLSSGIHTTWERSALQAMAFETATLPTRLTSHGDAIRGLMGDIEPTFTHEVKRNVLKLSLSASKPQEQELLLNGSSSRDHRMANGVSHNHDDVDDQPEMLDFDLLKQVRTSTTRPPNRQHIFSQTTTLRGFEAPPPSSPTHRSGYAATVQIYSTDLLAPRPTSFPHLFSFQDLDQYSSVAAKAALSATTDVAHRFRVLADVVRFPFGLPVEEREELRADLLAKAEEYVDGWEEDGSSDDE